MRVLLTGGAGDLGQTLTPSLLKNGDTPVVLDIRAPREIFLREFGFTAKATPNRHE